MFSLFSVLFSDALNRVCLFVFLKTIKKKIRIHKNTMLYSNVYDDKYDKQRSKTKAENSIHENKCTLQQTDDWSRNFKFEQK